jgi:hypothetical protein
MKKTLLVSATLLSAFYLGACGSTSTAGSSEKTEAAEKKESKEAEAKEEKNVLVEVIDSTYYAWKSYEDSEYTNIHAAAIFKNTGDTPVKLGETQMNHKAQDGSVLGTESMIYAVPDIVLPGETAIIGETSLLEGISPEEFKETTYNFEFDEATEEEANKQNIVEITGVKGTPLEDGYKVTGLVKNTTDEQQDDIRIAAALYDADGNLISVLKGSVDVAVAAGSETGFELSYPDVSSEVTNKVDKVDVKGYAFTW